MAIGGRCTETDTVDLEDELWGPVFESLKNIKVFKKFSLSPTLHTIVWENGGGTSHRSFSMIKLLIN